MTHTKKPILQVSDLTVSSSAYAVKRDIVRGVSFTLFADQTLALVGESGSGKTMTARSLVQLFTSPQIKITGGSILLNGESLLEKSNKEMRAIRGKEISFISQNPLNSLNPTLQVGTQLIEAIAPRRSKEEAEALAVAMLGQVGFSDCKSRLSAYPHELSGGMRQRLLIAMALINRPKILIADEPTTALDVTIQAQILDLLIDLQKKMSMSILFITHDMGVVSRIAHDVAVMYAGQIVEMADVDTLFYKTEHPYTKALLSCLPRIASTKELIPIPGAPPQVGRLLGKCPFLPRCSAAMKICASKEPTLQLTGPGHFVACHNERAIKESLIEKSLVKEQP